MSRHFRSFKQDNSVSSYLIYWSYVVSCQCNATRVKPGDSVCLDQKYALPTPTHSLQYMNKLVEWAQKKVSYYLKCFLVCEGQIMKWHLSNMMITFCNCSSYFAKTQMDDSFFFLFVFLFKLWQRITSITLKPNTYLKN